MADTILLVEDDRTYREEVVRYLRGLQFVVLEAGEFQQALGYLDQHHIDLIILDIGLGKKAAIESLENGHTPAGDTGYKLLEIIRARPNYLPLIILTSLDEPIYEVACLQRGADDFLLKRIEFEVLAARIQSHLRRAAMLRSVKTSAQVSYVATASKAGRV